MALSRLDLAALRLVNGAFYASATPFLFREFDARSKPAKELKNSPLQRLRQVLQSKESGHYVHRIDFGFDAIDDGTNMRYLEDLKQNLPLLLKKVP